MATCMTKRAHSGASKGSLIERGMSSPFVINPNSGNKVLASIWYNNVFLFTIASTANRPSVGFSIRIYTSGGGSLFVKNEPNEVFETAFYMRSGNIMVAQKTGSITAKSHI